MWNFKTDNMTNNKHVVVYDCETTGLSKQFDWIIQLSAIKFDKETFKVLGEFNSYIKPLGKYEINPDAEAVHGLSKEFIEQNGKTLKEVGPDFLKFIEGCDLMGYNSNNFDALMCYKDFTHAGLNWPVENTQYYDVLRMEQKIHPMNLGSVFERYLGKTMEQHGYKAHDSLADVKATFDVFRCQMEYLDWETIDEWQENHLLTPDGTVRNAANQDNPPKIVFAQGKYRDRDVYEVMKDDPSYLKWAAKMMFSSYTLNLVRQYCRDKQSAEKLSAEPKNK